MEEQRKAAAADAPGWAEVGGERGPICWKCSGTGEKRGAPCCPVCLGEQRLPKKKLRRSKPKPERVSAKGPAFANVSIEINPEVEEVSQLLGNWKILQSLKGGHRWSTDDLITAWVACKTIAKDDALPLLRAHLDLGCGIGTVLTMCAWYFKPTNPDYRGVGVEAQSASASKARRNLQMNNLVATHEIVECDFREFQTETRFDLITGTPPYFPVSQQGEVAHPEYGALPTFEQSAPARFEFRGGLEVYLETASRLLVEDTGVLVVCEGNLNAADGMKRVLASAANNALQVERSVFVHGREDKPALFAVHVLRRKRVGEQAVFNKEEMMERFVVRHLGGRRSDEYLAMCNEMGIEFVG